MEVMPCYKQTEAGVIPEDWGLKELGNIASVTAGGTPSRKNRAYWDGDIPWINTSQIDFNNITSAEQYITELGLKNSAAKLLAPGTLLLALYGQGKTRGKVCILGIQAATNQACASIVVSSLFSHEFVFHFLASQYDAIRDLSNSGSQENLNGQIVKSILIPLPPTKAEQEAIAEVLSDADALIESLERLIAKKRILKQGVMQELLTGRRRLRGFADATKGHKQTEVGMIPEDWGVATLGELISSLDAGVSVNSVDKEKDAFAHEESILKTSCVLGGKFFPEECKKIIPRDLQRAKLTPRADTIIISRMNTQALVGECGYVSRNYPNLFLPDRLWMAKLEASKPSNARWLAYLLSFSSFNRAIKESATGTSGSMKNISKASLLSVQIPLPSKAEQDTIAEVMSAMDAEITLLESHLAKYRQLKQGMMHNLLTGRIRLV